MVHAWGCEVTAANVSPIGGGRRHISASNARAQVLPRYVNYTVPIPWEQTHSQDGPAVNHMWHMVGEEARSLTLNTAAAQVVIASKAVHDFAQC